jgi:hypothetical protein
LFCCVFIAPCHEPIGKLGANKNSLFFHMVTVYFSGCDAISVKRIANRSDCCQDSVGGCVRGRAGVRAGNRNLLPRFSGGAVPNAA